MGEGSALPVGVPVPWPLPTPPEGWLKYNGAAFDKLKFPRLGAIYPGGVLPDLRGEFIRGWDDGRGVDNGRELLSAQGDAIRNISGTTNNLYNSSGSGSTTGAFTYQNGADDVLTAGSAAGVRRGNYLFNASNVVPTAAENRPRNAAFNYIVRAI
ncbi:tail fiber protein [Trabulsiella odontotermitis]|uniref:tail fiber protein n=1 Tax=Trabulsiella odontotermitis TaxID=379893 RepID=UPI003ABE22AC